jgi:hypothetical protein
VSDPCDLGDLFPLAVQIRDSDGAAADAEAVTVTVTLPDGTTDTPSIVHTTGSGLYRADYATIQPGRHLYRWVATGVNASTHSGMFDVRPAAPAMLVSLEAAKRKCNIAATDSSRDDDLTAWIEAATAVVEDHLNLALVRRTVTDTIDHRGGNLVLPTVPCLSVTSIAAVDGSTTWDVDDLHVDTATGIITVLRGPRLWGLLTVTYVAGMAQIPANYSRAALVIVEDLWSTERRLQASGPQTGMYGDAEIPLVGSDGVVRYDIPKFALKLLGKPRPLVG